MDRNVQMIVAYDGSDYHGWQRQTGMRTVQAHVESTVARVVRHPVNLIASGRTDAGVHASGQVVNFKTSHDMPSERMHHAVNSRLDADAAIVGVRDVPMAFHATHSAVSKLYRYRIYNSHVRPVGELLHRYTTHYYKHLDVQAMRRAAADIVGTHDFKALASTRGPERSSYVRTILDLHVYGVGNEVRIDVCGTGFLYNQVRNIAGTLIEIGRGHWDPDCVPEILASRDRGRAGPTAAAQGLCLVWVQYPPDDALRVEPAGWPQGSSPEDVAP